MESRGFQFRDQADVMTLKQRQVHILDWLVLGAGGCFGRGDLGRMGEGSRADFILLSSYSKEVEGVFVLDELMEALRRTLSVVSGFGKKASDLFIIIWNPFCD